VDTVLRHVRQRSAQLEKCQFFDWVNSDQGPIEDRLTFLPILANFSMGFRDINKWVLRYPKAANHFERGINIHTFEDETHSRLFLEDWRRLELDKRLDWRASETLWWLFLADANETARVHGIRFLSLAAADLGDPLLRFAHSEVIEACGAVFFGHVAPIASRLTERTGIDYRYLGPYHLARETGRMACEEEFEAVHLDDQRRGRALALADAMFDLFTEMFDTFLAYARRYVDSGSVPLPALAPRGAKPATGATGTTGTAGPGNAGAGQPVRADGQVHPSQASVQRLLEERMAGTARHPFYLWLHNRQDLPALRAVRRFFPAWAMDIMGYRDLNVHAIRYPDPSSPLQSAVNAWVADLGTHSGLYLNDWRELGLDQILGWTASDTLEFCFLDPRMDIHRRNTARFVHLAAAHTEPLLRLWLIHAMESNGSAFFEHCSALAAEVEASGRLRLDYLAGRHDLAHLPPATTERQSTPVAFKSLPLQPGDRDIIGGMIDTAFDTIDEHLTVALDVALSNTFQIP
jgi:hypothetical protein